MNESVVLTASIPMLMKVILYYSTAIENNAKFYNKIYYKDITKTHMANMVMCNKRQNTEPHYFLFIRCYIRDCIKQNTFSLFVICGLYNNCTMAHFKETNTTICHHCCTNNHICF